MPRDVDEAGGMMAAALAAEQEDEEDLEFLEYIANNDVRVIMVNLSIEVIDICQTYLKKFEAGKMNRQAGKNPEIANDVQDMCRKLAQFNLALASKGFSMNAVEKGELRADECEVPDDFHTMFSTLDANVSAFVELTEQDLRQMEISMTKSGYLLLYEGCTMDVILDIQLIPSRSLLCTQPDIIETMHRMLDECVLKYCPRDTHLLDRKLQDHLMCYIARPPEEKSWLFERAIAIATAIPMSPRPHYAPLEMAARLGCGYAHYHRTPPPHDADRQVLRAFLLKTEVMAVQLNYWRFGLNLATSLTHELEAKKLIHNVNRDDLTAKLLRERINHAAKQAATAAARARYATAGPGTAPRGVGGIPVRGSAIAQTMKKAPMVQGYDLLVYELWTRLGEWASQLSLQFGEAQILKNMVFWMSHPHNCAETARTTQPARVQHEIGSSVEHAWPGDFLLASFIMGDVIKTHEIISTYLILTAIPVATWKRYASKLKEDYLSMARKVERKPVTRPEDDTLDQFLVEGVGDTVKPQRYKVQLTKEMIQDGVTDHIANIMIQAPDYFIPGCTMHRRACIIATLIYLSSFLGTMNIPNFLETRIIENPVEPSFLKKAASVVRIGTELAFVDTKGRLLRVPDQDPLTFFYCYLDELVQWKTNDTMAPAAAAFKKMLNSIALT